MSDAMTQSLGPVTPRKAPDSFPRWVLWCAGGLIAFSLIAVGLVRITGNGPDQIRQSMPDVTAQKALRFEDRPNGGVAIIDGANGQVIAELPGACSGSRASCPWPRFRNAFRADRPFKR
jgi:hypothetical protein